MDDVALRVEHLGKRYAIGAQQAPTRSLRETLTDALNPARWARRAKRSDDTFWALKDVSFEVKHGEVLGVIGRNGAGKSTLLKVLSRITEPTEGQVAVRGRIGSLLEVGTGFHPELTGRENIFLNGAILGMRREEIRRKFDEIVAFSEIGQFLDTAVKFYSSGMYVRLAFAVAAHLEPEILVIDEVLAVGDAAFQQKCLGRMGKVAQEGRTVLFVSHNMGVLSQLCQSALWLVKGQFKAYGPAREVTSRYLLDGSEKSGELVIPPSAVAKDASFSRVRLETRDGEVTSNFGVEQPIRVRLSYDVRRPFKVLEISVRVCTDNGVAVFSTNRSSSLPDAVAIGQYEAVVEFPSMFLAPGFYTLEFGAHVPNSEVLALHSNEISFTIEETGSALAAYKGSGTGLVLARCAWTEECVDGLKAR